jgi:GNAT superfamily N-acetyltransferase
MSNVRRRKHVNIRAIQQNELKELLALYEHLHRTDEPMPEETVIQSVWKELRANPRYKYFGGYVGEALVSSCTITVIPNLTRGCKPYGLIENVVTHASHRNQGYGSALLKHALTHAWSAGCYKVMLLTGSKDEATFRFYESAGFGRHEKQAFVAKAPPNPSIEGDVELVPV